MANEKASQRARVIYEFGILLTPFVELAKSEAPPPITEYRRAMAKVQAGDAEWRKTVRNFVTFAPDVIFETEFQAISHVPEYLRGKVRDLLRDDLLTEPGIRRHFVEALESAEYDFFEKMEHIPLDWEPQVFAANTPFTSYLRIREAITVVNTRLHYFDRYLKPDFFHLYLQDVPRNSEIRLVTTESGRKAVETVSCLARMEFTNYQLLKVEPAQLHARNLRVDDQVFSIDSGVDRAGWAPTNFDPADSTPHGHDQLNQLIACATLVH